MITLGHPDSVSGTTILDDGTKTYWTEGHGDVVVVYPNGSVERIPTHAPHPIITALDDLGAGAMRCMTVAEMREYNESREDGTREATVDDAEAEDVE